LKIPFNRPYFTGGEKGYLDEAINSGHVSGNGPITGRCHRLLETDWGFRKVLLTSSGTDALEMSAMLAGIKPGDEVIVPGYTFVSTALAFAREGAEIVFADSRPDNPCIDETAIEELITERTKAIVPVHYNGMACDMDTIMILAEKYGLQVVEDAAHAFGSRYNGKLLGTLGHMGCFSFHETKIIHSGEGGMISLNREEYGLRAERIWEKGTNRCEFHRGKVSKYEWVDTGSSFLPSEITASFLLPQLESFGEIVKQRRSQWEHYFAALSETASEGFVSLPSSPAYSETNYSGFYITARNKEQRDSLQKYLHSEGIQAVTHYLDLSQSQYIVSRAKQKKGVVLENCRRYQDTLLRLPLYYTLGSDQITFICEKIISFFRRGRE